MNSTWYEQADDYLYGRMTEEERIAFESALAENKEQSAEFELYRSVESTMQTQKGEAGGDEKLKLSLSELNEIYFSGKEKARYRIMSRRVFGWTAAAALILVVAGVYLITTRRAQGPHQLADDYIQNKLTVLGQSMSGSRDLLQEGIAAYNNKDFKKALALFDSVAHIAPDNSDAKKYIGLAFLQTKNYDSAITYFDDLAAQKGLYSNPGLFLKAITLLHRNRESDITLARQVLDQVVTQKTEGFEEAAEWLKRF
jgi:tetratricopeptide (TPR) repeat protein